MKKESTNKNFEIIEDFGIIGRSPNGYTKHFILARWGNHPACYEVRTFKDGQPLKRPGMTSEELSTLKELLTAII